MTLLEWITIGEVGISSKTMWAAIMGTLPLNARKGGIHWNVPHDPDDFRRCLLLVRQCGLGNADLEIIAARVPWFAPIIDNWEELVTLYDQETSRGTTCPKLYERLRALEDESMVLDGWEKTGPGFWERKS